MPLDHHEERALDRLDGSRPSRPRASFAIACIACAVIAMMRMCFGAEAPLADRLRRARPAASGICTSISTTSNVPCRRFERFASILCDDDAVAAAQKPTGAG